MNYAGAIIACASEVSWLIYWNTVSTAIDAVYGLGNLSVLGEHVAVDREASSIDCTISGIDHDVPRVEGIHVRDTHSVRNPRAGWSERST